MKTLTTLLFFVTIVVNSVAQSNVQVVFQEATIQLCDSTTAANANKQQDFYSRALTPFDLQLRLGNDKNYKEADYLIKAATETRNWSEDEQQRIKNIFETIGIFLTENNIKLHLPKTIQIIKTNGNEEMGAEGYTRENRIMLNIQHIDEINVHLIAHELFHVFSRYNNDTRDKLYSIFGFKKCNVIYTDTTMGIYGITNPDCPVTEHYITINIDDKPTDMALQLYSKIGYDKNKNLGDYMNAGVLHLDGKKLKKPLLTNGLVKIYTPQDQPDFLKQISTNTGYIIHPEEITAENFALWISKIDVAQPEFLEKIKKTLQLSSH